MISRYSLFIIIQLIGIVFLQYNFWWGKTCFFATCLLNKDLSIKQEQNNRLQARNVNWYTKVVSLRQDSSVLEGIARENLGFIKNHEVFYQIAKIQNKKFSLHEDN